MHWYKSYQPSRAEQRYGMKWSYTIAVFRFTVAIHLCSDARLWAKNKSHKENVSTSQFIWNICIESIKHVVCVCDSKILARPIDIIQPTHMIASVQPFQLHTTGIILHWAYIVHEMRSWTKWTAITLNFTSSSSSYKLCVCVRALKPHEIFAKQSCKPKEEISHNMISINRLKCFNKIRGKNAQSTREPKLFKFRRNTLTICQWSS